MRWILSELMENKLLRFLIPDVLQWVSLGKKDLCMVNRILAISSVNNNIITGLQHASVVILLISELGLQNIQQAHERKDNVLLEYEAALEKYDNREICLFPLAIAKVCLLLSCPQSNV
jgi:hypothetical protein